MHTAVWWFVDGRDTRQSIFHTVFAAVAKVVPKVMTTVVVVAVAVATTLVIAVYRCPCQWSCLRLWLCLCR